MKNFQKLGVFAICAAALLSLNISSPKSKNDGLLSISNVKALTETETEVIGEESGGGTEARCEPTTNNVCKITYKGTVLEGVGQPIIRTN